MDKIVELLKQIGASDELAEEIKKELHNWQTSQQKKLDEELRQKLVNAKRVCIEEVENYKKEIARKVEIFLESQVAAVERGAQERQAIEESKAVNTLKRAKGLLEGITIDGNNGDLQAAKSQIEQLRRKLSSVMEAKEKVDHQFVKVRKIAEDALKRNRLLESKIAENTKTPAPKKGGTKLESARPQAGKTHTNRPTRRENQVPSRSQTQTGDREIDAIAASVDEVA